jgi:hypothetical protein
MTFFPDSNQLRRVFCRTQGALGISTDSQLSPDEAIVFLKYLLLEGLESSEIDYWRSNWWSDTCISLRGRLEERLRNIQVNMKTTGELEVVTGIAWDTLEHSLSVCPFYHNRLIDLAMEAILSEPLAPELCIKLSFSPQHVLSAALPGTWNHAIIFAASVFFTHEFYPLAVDAFVHDSKRFGSPQIKVMGAHMDWLTESGKLKRILYVDFVSGRLIETDLAVPLRPDSIQFLCLGRQEQEKHSTISQRIDSVQVNPASISMLADDKAATLFGWSAMGLEIPAYQEIAVGDLAAAFRFLDSFAEIVVKPNHATEGQHVEFFRRDQAQAKVVLERHLYRCWEQGSAIVQQRRDSVKFWNAVSEKKQTLALRLNIVFDGERYCLESGYAQLGLDEQHPAACGRGGNIVAIDEILSVLTFPSSALGKSMRLMEKDWLRIREQSEKAAGLFKGLLLVGLDVLLDHDEHGSIIPVFLEANPRPAGLSHSLLLSDDPFKPAQIGVSLKLWDCLGANQVTT